MKVTIGTKFRYIFADSNPEWEVKRSRGNGCWACTIVDDADYSGATKTFSTEEIEASLRQSEMWKKSSNDSETFFQNLKTGMVVHYNNGFQSYVRCVVTSDKMLLPIALVGDWKPYDLPRRSPNGEINWPYHVDKIHNKVVFQPHASNVYEYNLTRQKNKQPIGFDKQKNPQSMTPIPLTVPDPTEEEKKIHALWKKIDSIKLLLSSVKNPDETLKNIKNIIG